MDAKDRLLSDEAGRPSRLLTIKETGGRLGQASQSHVYRLIALGELRAVDISMPGSRKSKTRVREDDLADYIERKTRAPVLRT